MVPALCCFIAAAKFTLIGCFAGTDVYGVPKVSKGWLTLFYIVAGANLLRTSESWRQTGKKERESEADRSVTNV